MSHSSHVFTVIPPGYEKLAAMMRAGKPIDKCLKALVQLMHDDELEVFSHQLSVAEYLASIEQLKAYLLLQQKIHGRAPSLIDTIMCPVYDAYQQLLYKIDTTLFTFIKDFYRWQPLALALHTITEFEQPYQQALILTADMPLAAYAKQVKQAFLHWQQIKDGTLTENEWLLHFTHVLAQVVETSSEEKASQLAAFKKTINDLISRWYHYHQLLKDKDRVVSPEELRDAVYDTIPVPSAASVSEYEPAEVFAAPYVKAGSDHSFAAAFVRFGLLFTVSAHFGRAAGLTTPAATSSAMCVVGEASQSALVNPLQLMAAQQTEQVEQHEVYVKTPPDKQIMPDIVLQEVIATVTIAPDLAILKKTTNIMIAARAPIPEVAQGEMNAHQIAIAKLGMNNHPVEVFKHYSIFESPELTRDNHMFADAAAITTPDKVIISKAVLDQLEADVDKSHPEAARLLREVKTLKKEALFHVLTGYTHSNGLLKANTKKATGWAQIAANLGNVFAFQFLGERLYPYPDRDYAYLLSDIRTTCPSTEADIAAEKAAFLQESEHYLRIAAYWGHARGSYLLGEAYQWGYYGKVDKEKALSYYIQSIIQHPKKAASFRGAMQVAVSIIDDEVKRQKKFEQLSWSDFNASDYFAFYVKMSKTVKTLMAVVELADEALYRRAFTYQRSNVAMTTADSKIGDEAIAQLRSTLRVAKAKLKSLTMELGSEHVLPSPANLKEFGVYFEPRLKGAPDQSKVVADTSFALTKIRELAAAGSIDAAKVLGMMYAEGRAIKRYRDIAHFFFQQARRLQPKMSLDPKLQLGRIQNDEARLQPYLELAMRVAQNPFRATERHVGLARLPNAMARLYGIQIPSQVKSSEWSGHAIESPQIINTENLDKLQRDIAHLGRGVRERYERILSALRDGDYTEIAEIVSFYANNQDHQFVWLTVAASHGHLPSLRLLGRKLREKALMTKEYDEDLHTMGIRNTALAASLGNYDATRDMIEIVENKELNIEPLGVDVGDLIWFYKSQCYRQDPKRTLDSLVENKFENAFQRAKYADGSNRRFHSLGGEDLAWHPIMRDGSDLNMGRLIALLKQHHPNSEAVSDIVKQFYAGDNKCFMRAVQLYKGSVPGVAPIVRNMLVISWAAMGFRSGDTQASTTIYGVSLNLNKLQELPIDIIALFIGIYKDIYNDSALSEPLSLLEKVNRLAADSICFSAYYYDAMASVVHSKLKTNMEVAGWQRVNILSHARALLAQSVMQGSNDWRIYFDFSHATILVLEQIKQQSSERVTEDLRYLSMEEMLYQEHLLGLREFLDLTLLKLEYEYYAKPVEVIEKNFVPYLNEVKRLFAHLDQLSNYSLITEYREAGVELQSERNVFDGMHRAHQPWERQIVPALRSPDFTVEQLHYLRSKTLRMLKEVKHNALAKLEHSMPDNPVHMLEIHSLCKQQGERDLAAFWLKAAARAGDPVARRLMLTQGVPTHKELTALAAQGEVGATELILASSDTPKKFRPLLQAQVKRLKQEFDARDLYLPKISKQPVAVQAQPESNYFKYIMSAVLALIAMMLSIYGVKRVNQSRKHKEKLAAQKQKTIENLLAHFRVINHLEFVYHDELQVVVARFQGAQQQKRELCNANHANISVIQCSADDKNAVIDPLLQRARHALRQARIIEQHDSLTDEAVLAILGFKVSRTKKSDYVYKPTYYKDIHVEYDADIERELFETFVTMSGFTLAYQPDGVCHLQAVDQQSLAIDATVKTFCSAVWDLILLGHQQRIAKAKSIEAELLAQQQAYKNKYQFALTAIKSYDAARIASLKEKTIALRDEMLNTKVKLASDVARLCEDLMAKLDECPEKINSTDQDETILFESSLTRGLLLLQENHEIRKRVKEEVEIKKKHAVEKASQNLDKYNGAKKRAEKARQAEEARKQAAQQELAKAKKKEVAAVAPAPVPAAVQAEKPKEHVKVVRDITEVDFSKMQVLAPKSTRFFSAAAPRQPKPPTIRSLVIDPKLAAIINREERVWPFDLIDHHRGLLNEIMSDIAFQPKSCEQFRLRALSFRLMRYLLLLQSFNKDGGDEVRVPSSVRNKELKRSLTRFVAGIKHNFHLIKLTDLESCVRACFIADTDDITAVIREALRSPLCAVILPRQNNVVIPRNEVTIFTELGTYFDELKAIDVLYNKLAMSKLLDDACHDGYRGIIMMIGEVGQWLYLTCPQLKNEIFENYPELRDFMYFIVMCHVLHRNNYAHVVDLNAMYESSLADFPFVADNLYSTTLSRFVWRGIKIGCQEGLCEQLKSAYIATKQKMAAGNNNNIRQDNFEQELKHSYISMMDLHMDGESESMKTNISPRQKF